MSDRISTLDKGYSVGDLSIYPQAKDDYETIYRATNNAEAVLTQSLTYSGRFAVVNDTSKFADSGLVKIGEELIFYASKTSTVFKDLRRGFANSTQRPWPAGSVVQASVMAEHHNSEVDAIINIEANLGLKENPTEESLNGILKSMEERFLAPKPLFRAVPRTGPAPLDVHFQNFSGAPAIRFLWDFGDGGTSVEANPTHTYTADGIYTVKLSMITPLGGTGITTKIDYVIVSAEEDLPFFYVDRLAGDTSTTFTFVDQTKGEITSRYWIWDDGTSTTSSDPDEHIATHVYTTAGEYDPNLLLVFADGKLKRISLNDTIIVS